MSNKQYSQNMQVLCGLINSLLIKMSANDNTVLNTVLRTQ